MNPVAKQGIPATVPLTVSIYRSRWTRRQHQRDLRHTASIHPSAISREAEHVEDAGSREGVRVADVVGGGPRAGVPLREGCGVPAHPRRLLPRPQPHAPVPQAPAARRGAHLRGRQRHPRRVEEDPEAHRGQVQGAGEPGPDRDGGPGALLHRAVAADGGAELRHAQRRHDLQPRVPAAHHAARRQEGRRRQWRRWPRRQAAAAAEAAGHDDEPDPRAETGGDEAAVREEQQGSGQGAGHLRPAPGGGRVPGRRQVHPRRPLPHAQRRPPRLRPPLRPPHPVPQERQPLVGRRLRPRVLGVRQEPAAPAGIGGALLISIHAGRLLAPNVRCRSGVNYGHCSIKLHTYVAFVSCGVFHSKQFIFLISSVVLNNLV